MKLHTTAIVCMTVLLALPASASPARRSLLPPPKGSTGHNSLDHDTVTYTIVPYSFATTMASTGTSLADAITGVPDTTLSSSLPSVESYDSAPASTYASSSVFTSSADAQSASSSTSPSATTVTTWLSEAVTVTTTLWTSSSTTPKYTCTVNEATTLTRTAIVTATATVVASKGTAPVLSTFSAQSWSLTVPWTNSSAETQTWTALAASAFTGSKQPHGNATHTWATHTASCSEETAAGGALRTKATSLSRSRPFSNTTTTMTKTTLSTRTKATESGRTRGTSLPLLTASWTSVTKHEKPTTTLEMYH